MIRKLLLVCGILAALLYVGSDILAAMRWEGYRYVDQSVSELRAIGAPTRTFLLPILTLYTLLEIAFGFGIWQSAGGKRSLHIAGALLIALGLLDLTGPFFALNLNEEVGSVTNMLHLLVTVVTVVLLLLIMAFGAAADGKGFRFYTYATILIVLIAGVVTFMYVPRLEAGLPTTGMGIIERINIYGYMLWLAMLALVLWRTPTTLATRKPPTGISAPQPTPP